MSLSFNWQTGVGDKNTYIDIYVCASLLCGMAFMAIIIKTLIIINAGLVTLTANDLVHAHYV